MYIIMKKIKKNIAELVISIFIISFGIFLVLSSEHSMSEVRSSIKICCNVLIPSLFPFMFFSSLMINSGTSNKIGKILYPVSKYLFRLPSSSVSVIFLSMVGGFPVGAKGISDLFEKKMISENQANRMLSFCVNAGPAFILGVLGNSFIKNMEIAKIILLSQIISSLIVGVLTSFFSKEKTQKYDKETEKIHFSECLIKSCESSSIAMMNMCMLIIIFNVFSVFLGDLHFFYVCSKIFSSFRISQEISDCFPQIIMEVTKACEFISSKGVNPCLISFATSWGGLCVHFQIFSIVKKIKINYLNFFVFRLLNAILSSIIALAMFEFKNSIFDIKMEIPQSSTHFLGSLALIFCCLIFLIDLNFKKLGGGRDEQN